MAIMQTNTETELSSVNSILGAIGQSPVTSLYIERGEVRTVSFDTSAMATADWNAYTNGTTYDLTTSSGGLAKGLKISITITDKANAKYRADITAPGTNYQVNDTVSLVNSLFSKWVTTVTGLITDATFINPEVSFVYQLLMECNIDVQNEGWVFNTEQDYPVPLEPDNTITIPTNVLRLDQFDNLDVKRTDTVMRTRNGEKKLYDKFNHTYEFKPFGATRTFRAEIIWLFPYEDLPSVFQRYITTRASVRAATQMVTNQQLAQMLMAQEQMLRAACMEYECNQSDSTMFGLPDGSSYRSYKPFQALRR